MGRCCLAFVLLLGAVLSPVLAVGQMVDSITRRFAPRVTVNGVLYTGEWDSIPVREIATMDARVNVDPITVDIVTLEGLKGEPRLVTLPVDKKLKLPRIIKLDWDEITLRELRELNPEQVKFAYLSPGDTVLQLFTKACLGCYLRVQGCTPEVDMVTLFSRKERGTDVGMTQALAKFIHMKHRFEMPLFLGESDILWFRTWLSKELRYPPQAMREGIQGRVLLSFVVNAQGKVCDIKELKSPNVWLTAEAIRMLKECPDWTPGTHYGEPISTRYTLPIDFKMQDRARHTPPPASLSSAQGSH